MAALSALKTEVLELSTRLQNSECERDSIQKKLSDALEEKERSQRRLEAIASAHESRITEMHCVIVELSKKLKNQQENAIIEEQEPDGSGNQADLEHMNDLLSALFHDSQRTEFPGGLRLQFGNGVRKLGPAIGDGAARCQTRSTRSEVGIPIQNF